MTGFDPTHKGFYHGGDLRGLIDQLDYIEDLGTTAIWMTPSFKNKPVQGAPGAESAGYHGYWITDFTQIDPHLGTNADLQGAHRQGARSAASRSSSTSSPTTPPTSSTTRRTSTTPASSRTSARTRRRTATPTARRSTTATTPSATRSPRWTPTTSFPYLPTFRTQADETAKTPAWLNDPTMYHNRGTSTFTGENSEYGDFPAGDRRPWTTCGPSGPRSSTG